MLSFEQKILDEFQLVIKIAGEIEFYIAPALNEEQEDKFLKSLFLRLTNGILETEQSLQLWNVQKEVAPSQYEVALQPSSASDASKNIDILKNIIAEVLYKEISPEHKALFAAKPFENLPGCGLHIHIGIYDEHGNSALNRKGEFLNREGESDIMIHAIGGLCHTMLKNFIYFAPKPESYLRFCADKNTIENSENHMIAHNNAPINVSWGGNNRTTAIRIPPSTENENNRHIEHRVAGADAPPPRCYKCNFGRYLSRPKRTDSSTRKNMGQRI